MRDHILGSRLLLQLQPAQFIFRVDAVGVHPHPGEKGGGIADPFVSHIDAMVQVMDQMHQADGIDIKYGRCLRIVPDHGRIPRDGQDIAYAHGSGPQQVRLHAQQVPVPAGIMQHRFDAYLVLQQNGQGQPGHPGRGTGSVRNIDGIHPVLLQEPCTLQRFADIGAAGRNHLHQDHLPARNHLRR